MMSNKLMKKIILVFSIMVMLVVFGMIIGNAWYTVYFLDDFNHATRIGSFNVGLFDYIKATYLFTKMMYNTWQGTYFSMFLQGLLSPLNNGGLLQLRIVMVFNAILFLSSFLFFLNTLISTLDRNIGMEIRMSVFALVFVQQFSSIAYPEIFSWFSGATCYSFPLSFLFISISLALYAEKSHKTIFTVMSIVTGFFAMGGVLAITGMGCSFMLVLFASLVIIEKKPRKNLLIVFASYLAFALFATLAPGNFERRGYVEASINPLKAGFLTAKKYLYVSESLFKDTGIIVVCLLLLLIGIIVGKYIEETAFKKYFIASVLVISVPFATIFPIVLGYGDYTYFPNRCTFLANITITLVVLNISLLMGVILRKYVVGEKNTKLMLSLLVIIALVCFLREGNRMEENSAVIQINNLANGSVRTFYNETNALLDEIKNSSEEDVVLERNPYSVPQFAEFYLSQDETFGLNVDLANFYGKNSIRIK